MLKKLLPFQIVKGTYGRNLHFIPIKTDQDLINQRFHDMTFILKGQLISAALHKHAYCLC